MSKPVFASAESAMAYELGRIADTLDDYMEMSLSGQEILMMAKTLDPETAKMYEPIIQALQRIKERRRGR